MPDHWIERLFQKFEDWYGAKWAAQYGAFPRERVKATWAEELGGFGDRPESIAAALQTQKVSPWPPTLPEFLELCRAADKRSAPKVLAIDHKRSAEDDERSRARVAKIAADLAEKMAVRPSA